MVERSEGTVGPLSAARDDSGKWYGYAYTRTKGEARGGPEGGRAKAAQDFTEGGRAKAAQEKGFPPASPVSDTAVRPAFPQPALNPAAPAAPAPLVARLRDPDR